MVNQKTNPFAFPNGIFVKKRLQILREKAGGSKMECKKYIQLNYFGYNTPDYSVPIYSFVGRLTQQKGVLMIIDSAEELIRRTNGKINILIGGMGLHSDGYLSACKQKISYLKNKYPYAFWANPDEFFTDGPRINLGSDFGLMPSQFEPGGIVQHEFFIGGTPVIAYKTGGLKDTVFEFNWQTNTGNGITFENYSHQELVNAILRSIDLFNNKEKYEICSRNAYKSTIDVSDVSKAWCKEFFRLKNKLFFNNKEVQDLYMAKIPESSLIVMNNNINDDFNSDLNEGSISHENTFNSQKIYDSMNRSKNSNMNNHNYYNNNNNFNNNNVIANEYNYNKYYTVMDVGEVVKTFVYYFPDKQPNVVELSGSFDNWKKKHRLIHKTRDNKFEITIKLKKGKHFYKYIVDGNWQINPNEPSEMGEDGIVNNVVSL